MFSKQHSKTDLLFFRESKWMLAWNMKILNKTESLIFILLCVLFFFFFFFSQIIFLDTPLILRYGDKMLF